LIFKNAYLERTTTGQIALSSNSAQNQSWFTHASLIWTLKFTN